MQNAAEYLDKIIDVLINNINCITIPLATSLSNTGWSYETGIGKDFEICFFISGSTKMKCKDIESEVKAGEVFIFDSSESIKSNDGNFTFLTFIFNLDSAIDNKLYEEIKSYFSYIIGKHDILNVKALDFLYKSLISEYLHKNHRYELNMKLLLIQILVEISKPKIKGDSSQFFENSKYSKLSWEIASYISENLDSKISLSDLGEKYKLNPRYLNRIFKSVTGLPIIQYRQQLKIDKARKMLKTSANTISDISADLDFSTSQYFSYIFKKITGQTPRDYRK